MEEEKDNSQSVNLKRSPVILLAIILLVAVIVLTIFKIAKSLRQQANPVQEEPVQITKPIHKENVAVKVNSDSIYTAKIAALYKQYFTVDTLPKKYPPFLLEAFSGYQMNEYIYLKELNLTDIPEKTNGKENGEKELVMFLGHYYKGIAFLMLNDNEQAISNLIRSINKAVNGQQRIKAEWYLALAYLKNNDAEKAIDLLEKISINRTNIFYAHQSQSILKELKQ